ncbi:MAG: hypothetical protein H0W44_03140 [Gammaproteobacteria bacterium]|nr:hypothetical protein [Gammaproteobacteria bacterium]
MPPQNKQQGQALLVLLLMISVTASIWLTSLYDEHEVNLLRQQNSMIVLQTAKTALKGVLIEKNSSATTRPGLPCPDFNNDGNYAPPIDTNGNNCKTYRGWFPWRRVRLDDIRDASNERLWYVVDPAFQIEAPNGLNPDVVPTLTLDNKPVVAILIAPGAPLTGQQRTVNDSQADANVSHYLDTRNAMYDASLPITTLSFYNGDGNDVLIGISKEEYFAAIWPKVAMTTRDILLRFYADPNPAITTEGNYFPSASALTAINCGISDTQLTGRLCASVLQAAVLQNNKQQWWLDDEWAKHIYYAVAADCVNGQNCDGSGSYLTLNTKTQQAVVLGFWGAPLSNGNNICNTATGNQVSLRLTQDICGYFDSVENTNADAVYQNMKIDAHNNDRFMSFTP